MDDVALKNSDDDEQNYWKGFLAGLFVGAIIAFLALTLSSDSDKKK